MKDTLSRLLKLINAIQKIIPVLIAIIEDWSDDGKLNNSNEDN